ncbi:DUF1294 domain-containing protein [Marinobacterium rhizophilum]|uniref:Cold shock and DUF1294 domain-containing protein n=1 Tax=Marinobacterium rhizophilum TaxID=420402 RepID=A0ABY5HG59_9GAMM|nr:cold shock and DUF1294 domain-containing protein [Marinobacterium rhizophilum]UTW11228.1 cold shock and DUF1294 domain-containing protein [Marinobacterium rhizophilum]
MRHQGRITRWKDDQGFGFITPDGGGEPVFVHIKSFASRRLRPSEQDVVTYTLGAGERGPQALKVSYPGERRPASRPRRAGGNGTAGLLFAGVFLGFIAVAVMLGKLPLGVAGLYGLASLLTWLVYWKDKCAAQKEARRTPEKTLHLLALIGGWPGAMAAQQILRHKSIKGSFRFVFWLTVIANCAVLGWLLSPGGAAVLGLIAALGR